MWRLSHSFNIAVIAGDGIVRHPDWFDVVVGSIGIAPSANLNPENEYPMLEPVHESAPDIAGNGIANPIGQIWSGPMMLRHLGIPEAADAVENAIARVLAQAKLRTPDIGGNATTQELSEAIASQVSGAK